MWHRLFHRNPGKYPLPYGFGCRGCDRERAIMLMDMASRGPQEAAAAAEAFRGHTAFLRSIGR